MEARLSILLQILINPGKLESVLAASSHCSVSPVYFPLTVTAVLPIMITLASRTEAAQLPRPGWLQEAGSRRLGWLMFTAVYR